ncbi:PQQ-binding-like beta-propeller repeat protein [Nannocystis pusilla]|uniref:PQQ-binding-like beta-propeller repeat protein n=1 Tax=Nannocystis pusilla TaxID=889268 RepID=A0ABS7TIP6_9BACT|nr:PQQ-binding-like beta-propeller repeat protein [Nannocystis pusilla]
MLAACAACPASSGDSDTDHQLASTDATSTTIEPTTGAPTTSSSGTSTVDPPTTGTTTGGLTTCPDGQVDDGEACDDGNTINGDGCNNDCVPSGELLFEHHPATDDYDAVRAVAVGDDGSIFVGGRAPGFAAWVARFDDQLQPVWSQSFQPGSYGLVLGVAVGESSLYAAGGFPGDIDEHDGWAAKLSFDGVVEWEHTIRSGLGYEYLTQAVAVEDGVIVAGFGVEPDESSSLWARRYAADGTEAWTASHTLVAGFDSHWPLGPALAVTPDAVVVGYSRHAGDEQYPAYLAAFAPGDGGPLWNSTLPAPDGFIRGIAGNAGGLVLVASRALEGMGIRQLTSTGDPVWSTEECPGKSARDVAVDSQGDIVVIGDGSGGIQLCKLTPDGALRWARTVNGPGLDLGITVAIDAADRIIAGGSMDDDDSVEDVWLAIFSP